MPGRPGRMTLLLFLGTWSFYTFFHPGRTLTADSAVTLDTVRALARGGISIPQNLVTIQGREGFHYSRYGPLLPLVSLPGYLFGRLLDEDPPLPGEHRLGWGDSLALATNQWISALMVVLLFDAALISGARRSHALSLGLLAAVSTMLLPYSRDYFSQPLAACCLLGSGYSLIRFRKNPVSRWLAISSVSLGLTVLARMDLAVVVPGVLVWVGWEMRRAPQNPFSVGRWVAVIVPPVLCLGALVLYNAYLLGGKGISTYQDQAFTTPLVDSISRFLFSPDLSVFLYNPLLAAAMVMMALTWRENRRAWLGILLGDLCYLVLVGKFHDYHGGICPGPRYLLSLVPLNFLPLAVGLGRFRSWRRTPILLLGLMAIPGILVNGYAASVDYTSSPGAWDFWTGVLWSG